MRHLLRLKWKLFHGNIFWWTICHDHTDNLIIAKVVWTTVDWFKILLNLFIVDEKDVWAHISKKAEDKIVYGAGIQWLFIIEGVASHKQNEADRFCNICTRYLNDEYGGFFARRQLDVDFRVAVRARYSTFDTQHCIPQRLFRTNETEHCNLPVKCILNRFEFLLDKKNLFRDTWRVVRNQVEYFQGLQMLNSLHSQ